MSRIATLLVLAIGFGVVFAWTRSLVPSIVAHAIINLPMAWPWQLLILPAFVIGGVVLRRRGMAVLRHVFSSANIGKCVALGVMGAGYAIAAQRIGGLVFAAAAMVVLAVVLEVVDRQRERRAEPSTVPTVP